MDVSLGAELAYLFSSVLFVVGLKRLQSPATARGGNRLAALAMLIAIVATLVDNQVLSWTGIAAGMVVGSLIGSLAARTVKMTDMPQLVGIFNGFGGGASALVAAVVDAASRRHAASVWLGVNQHNARANRFYAKSDFETVGSKRFLVGDTYEDDWVRERAL